MTPDELRSVCRSRKTPLALAEALGDLTEPDRKKLSKTAQEIYKSAREAERDNWGFPTYDGGIARLVMLACCPWSQAKRVNSGGRGMFPDRGSWMDAVFQILVDRRPSWADDWIALELDVDASLWRISLSWTHVRELMKAGVIQRPTVDGYFRLLAECHREFDPDRDADVLEADVWRLFEVDTSAFDWFEAPKKMDRDKWQRGEWATVPNPLHEGFARWPWRLCQLAHRGEIDRGRLLDAALAALWRDLRGPMRTGLVRFLKAVDPTDEEIGTREASYRELLRSEQGPVVGMALKALGNLQKAKQLHVGEFLEAVPAAFGISAKSQPKSALSLIDRVTNSAPEHLTKALDSAAAALNHESADVQEKALDLLAKWKEADESLDLSRVIEAATSSAAHHRRRLKDLAGKRKPDDSTESDASAASELDQRRQSLIERLASLPQWVWTATCLDGIEEALQSDGLPPVFDPEPGQCPVLSGVEPIEPIRDVDELIDAVSHLFEIIEGPEEIERIVDGLIRLGGQPTADFGAKTKGLRQTKFNSEWIGQTMAGMLMWSVPGLIKLVGRWLGVDFRRRWPTERGYHHPAMDAFDQRLEALLPRWANGRFGPVLATPTHRGGWIDPRVFLARLKTILGSGQLPNRLDLIGGLLRLAPDFREEALQSAGDLPSPYGRIVRYALGGDECPTEADRDRRDQWLAAGRTRQPCGFLEELRILGLDDRQPDGATPAVFRFQSHVDPEELKLSRYSIKHRSQCVEVTPGLVGKDSLRARPTIALASALLLECRGMSIYQNWQQELIASLWPAHPDATLAAACDRLMPHLDDKGGVFEPGAGLLSPLEAVDRGWPQIGRVAIYLGLLSRSDQARGIAIDVLIDGIVDGRAHPDELAKALLHVASGGWIKLNRLADSLREVTRTSILAERVVAAILDRLIGSWQPLPRDGHHVLTLQLELLSNLQQAPSDTAREVLTNIKGSGKAAKLAKQLSKLEADTTSTPMRQAALEAAEGRLARAERIARFTKAGSTDS